jgi:DNA-binding GntR family transcriptional regulator
MPRRSAQQLAYDHLHAEIVSGRLRGGLRIKPEPIASQLGVSRMPVREAIRQLDAEGFVTIRPNRGAVVTQRTPDDALELFEMRAVLEGLAVRLGARNAQPDDLAELDHLITVMHRAAGDPARWAERHDQFHDRLCDLSNRPRLISDVRRLRLAVKPYVRMYAATHDNPEIPGHEHELILDAVRDRDARRAERLTIAHIMTNAEEIAAYLAEPAAETRTRGRSSGLRRRQAESV